jgi:hypothetical protein
MILITSLYIFYYNLTNNYNSKEKKKVIFHLNKVVGVSFSNLKWGGIKININKYLSK